MNNPYLQVLCTYFQRWVLLLLGALSLFCMVPVVLECSHQVFGGIAAPLIMFGAYLGSLVKEQFANPRARLIPGFVRVHLSAAAVFAATYFAMAGCVFACAGGCALVGGLSIVVGLVALGVWSQFAFLGMGVTAAVMVIAPLSSSAGNVAQMLLRGDLPLAAGGVVVAGLAILAYVGYRLAILSEEDPTYWTRSDGMRKDRGRPEPTRGLSLFSRYWRDGRIDAAMRTPLDGAWSLARRMRAASGQPSPVLACMIATGGAGLMFCILLGPRGGWTPRWGCAVPLCILPMYMRGWRQVIEREVLKPISRAELLKAAGLLLAVDVLQVWVTFCVMNAVLGSLLSSDALWNVPSWVAMGVFLGAAVMFYGTVCWLALIKWEPAWIGAFTGMCVLLVVGGDSFAGLPISDWGTLSAVMAVAGVVLAWRAYHHWLSVDLA